MIKENILSIKYFCFILIIPGIILSSSGTLRGQDTTHQEKKFSTAIQAGYNIPQNTTGNSNDRIDGGFLIRPSVHYKFSNNVTGLLEFNISSHTEHSNKTSKPVTFRSINLGLRIFPEPKNKFYLKTEISYFVDDGFPILLLPQLVGGVGNDFNIYHNLDIFGEAEIITEVFAGFSLSFSISAGIKYSLF